MWKIAVIALLISPPSESWQTLSTAHFELRYPAELSRVARDLEQHFEPTLAAVAADLQVKDVAKILVVLAPDREAFFALQPPGVPEWASGTSYPDRSSIYLKPLDPREVRATTLPGIFSHELAHLILHQRLAGAHPPRWLDEGIASRYGRSLEWDLVGPLLGVGLTGRYLPFSALAEEFPESGTQARLAYAQSTDLVGFLLKTYGPAAFNNFLDRIAAGEPAEPALEEAFGQDLAELSARWLKQVRWTYGLVGLLLGGIPLWFLVALLGIWAYARKRRTSRRRRELWDLEDRAAALQAADEEADGDEEDETLPRPPTYH